MKPTVSKELYKRLLEHGGFVASGEMELWKVLDATGSTITRKARLLADEGYLEVEYRGEHNHAFYKARRTRVEATKMAPDASVEESKPKLRPEFIYDGKSPRPVGVKMVPL